MTIPTLFFSLFISSSVARGGGGARASHWLVKYAKSHHFGGFEAEFLRKIENSPPYWKTAPPQTFGFPIWAEKSASISAKTFFFWRPLDFGRKKPLNFRFRPKNQPQFRRRPFFFGDHLILGGKNL